MKSVSNVCPVLCDLFIVNVVSILYLTPDHRELYLTVLYPFFGNSPHCV